jgi:hypothetical protein
VQCLVFQIFHIEILAKFNPKNKNKNSHIYTRKNKIPIYLSKNSEISPEKKILGVW